MHWLHHIVLIATSCTGCTMLSWLQHRALVAPRGTTHHCLPRCTVTHVSTLVRQRLREALEHVRMQILYDGLADRHNARGKYIDRCNSAAAQQRRQQWRCAVETYRPIDPPRALATTSAPGLGSPPPTSPQWSLPAATLSSERCTIESRSDLICSALICSALLCSALLCRVHGASCARTD